ncbi:uncharacterized protein LOC120778709 isoform X1 [Bactrocera tryoni]|uniref:uncharacterized protein LOC120778709 isoform X1 n=2 Tax=Bactrocera tryoni TaxID=59916 RepID=UPI001A981A3B|nr:uncharacterized protein LOC120778709 isoform X1 [Bactrocera tryoni]
MRLNFGSRALHITFKHTQRVRHLWSYDMDSYLTEIKQLRIPRPKFEPNGSPPNTWHRLVRPYTPPRDYHLLTNEIITTASALHPNRSYQGGAEEFRPTLHEKM